MDFRPFNGMKFFVLPSMFHTHPRSLKRGGIIHPKADGPLIAQGAQPPDNRPSRLDLEMLHAAPDREYWKTQPENRRLYLGPAQARPVRGPLCLGVRCRRRPSPGRHERRFVRPPTLVARTIRRSAKSFGPGKRIQHSRLDPSFRPPARG